MFRKNIGVAEKNIDVVMAKLSTSVSVEFIRCLKFSLYIFENVNAGFLYINVVALFWVLVCLNAFRELFKLYQSQTFP